MQRQKSNPAKSRYEVLFLANINGHTWKSNCMGIETAISSEIHGLSYLFIRKPKSIGTGLGLL